MFSTYGYLYIHLSPSFFGIKIQLYWVQWLKTNIVISISLQHILGLVKLWPKGQIQGSIKSFNCMSSSHFSETPQDFISPEWDETTLWWITSSQTSRHNTSWEDIALSAQLVRSSYRPTLRIWSPAVLSHRKCWLLLRLHFWCATLSTTILEQWL